MALAIMQKNKCCVICNTLPYALLVIDNEDKIIAHNQAFLDFLPSHPTSICGEPLGDLIPCRQLLAGAYRVRDSSAGEELEFIWPSSAGSSRFIRVFIVPLPGNGELQLMLEDISDQVRLRADLIDSERHEGIQQLAQVVAHELGSALSITWHTVSKLKEQIKKQVPAQPLDPLLESSLGRIENLRRKMSGLRLKRHSPMEPVDVHQQIDNSLFLLKEETGQRGITVEVKLIDSSPVCSAHRLRIRQVFLSLIRNALEAMPGGGTLEICSRIAGDSAPESLLIEVRDTGTGMSGDELAEVFKPLSSSKPSGIGLGLPLCRRILATYGGEIELDSREGEGTTVTVTLPVIKS